VNGSTLQTAIKQIEGTCSPIWLPQNVFQQANQNLFQASNWGMGKPKHATIIVAVGTHRTQRSSGNEWQKSSCTGKITPICSPQTSPIEQTVDSQAQRDPTPA
jgi:hypothetical protein